MFVMGQNSGIDYNLSGCKTPWEYLAKFPLPLYWLKLLFAN